MINWTALSVFIILFLLVTVMGFLAARWRRGDLGLLNEWGLGGQRFGTLVTWFLLGGDLYTAYTFIAVPALVYGSGAIGFYALPYTIIVYPFVFVLMPRLWSVARKHGYITPADFVRGRYDSHPLALAVAATGILATMPYIALQLVGIEVVLAAMGIAGDLPLVIAFVILAAYTYFSGLRAPAMIALVKDSIIYITVLVAVIAIPVHLGGFGHIFAAVPKPKLLLSPAAFPAYATLALGSALALFMYPHSITGVLSSQRRDVVRRNMALLPAYSFLLGAIALLGYMAIAAGIQPSRTYGAQWAVPALFNMMFPSWFAGFAFAAIAIGALVPASIMSIAAANLFTRNIYREYFRKNCTDAEESATAKLVSLVVKAGALLFILFAPTQYAINLQLLGGVWIIQTLPAIAIGLYTRWLHRYALLIGWAVGMALGTYMALSQGFKSSIYPLAIGGFKLPGYAALYAVIANLIVAAVLTWIFRAANMAAGQDETSAADYGAEVPATPAGGLAAAI
ncbi:MAG TPA: sodium:solute symporter [Chloroflexota bacterium]|nr:sodium:solute symporter [Chloroflexota bacterium]